MDHFWVLLAVILAWFGGQIFARLPPYTWSSGLFATGMALICGVLVGISGYG